MKFKECGVEFEIKGYEKHRYDDDDSWANVLWKIHNEYVHYENNSYDISSVEVERLRDKIKKFLDGEIKENDYFEPIEAAFRIEFYPKGKDYGRWLEPITREPLSFTDVQIYIFFVDDSDYTITDSSFNFFIDEEELEDLYNYLIEITN